jgi:hypothetical protein
VHRRVERLAGCWRRRRTGGGGGGIYGGGGGGAGETAGASGGRGSSGSPYGLPTVVTTDTTGVPEIEITPVLAPQLVADTEGGYFNNAQALGTTSTARSIQVENIGSEPAQLTALTFAGDHPADFFTESTTCGSVVAVDASCEIRVAFAPTQTGQRNATLILESDSEYPQEVPLTGFAVSNQFSFVEVIRNKTKGTAKVVVKIPGPGLLKLTGLGVKTQRKTALGPKARLAVVPKDRLRARLERAGEVRVKVTVTYTPVRSEAPRSKTRWVKLVLS